MVSVRMMMLAFSFANLCVAEHDLTLLQMRAQMGQDPDPDPDAIDGKGAAEPIEEEEGSADDDVVEDPVADLEDDDKALLRATKRQEPDQDPDAIDGKGADEPSEEEEGSADDDVVEDATADLDDDAKGLLELAAEDANGDAANMTGKCKKWCAKRYEKFAKQGKQAKLVATCRKKACAGCDMCGPEPTPQPTPAPTPAPTPQPTAAVQVKTANWWSSFDRKGWSTTPGGFTGIFRNDCNALYCIEEIHYADFPLGECYEANWWHSFDRKGWSTCNDGFYITGLYRNDCNSLYCIEAAKCCKKKSADSYPSSCYNANWWHSFDRKGWSDCKTGYSIAGLYRNDCNSLYCIEEVKCCPY